MAPASHEICAPLEPARWARYLRRMSEELRSTLEAMKTRFKPGSVDKKTTYYLSLGEKEGEKWTITLTPTGCEVAPGKIEKADCVLKMSAELFVKLVGGTFQPGLTDFMSGKIKTSDLDLLKRLQQAFGF
jgi:putative sterol carrier protein